MTGGPEAAGGRPARKVITVKRLVVTFVLLLVLLPILLAMVRYLPERNYFHYANGYEVKVKLTVGGEPVVLRRIVSCTGYNAITDHFSMYTKLIQDTYSFGRRLPGGGAVAMIAPQFCGFSHKFPPEGDNGTSDWWQALEEHLPVIGWTADPDGPEEIIVPVDHAYFERPDAKFVYHSMWARRVHWSATHENTADEFHVAQGGWNGHIKDKPMRAYALFGRSIPEEEWSQHEELAAHLRTLTEVTLLDPKIEWPMGHFSTFVCGTMGVAPWPSAKGSGNCGERTGLPLGLASTVFRNRDGLYQVPAHTYGSLAFYGADDFEKDRTKPSWNYKFEVNGVLVNLPGTTAYISWITVTLHFFPHCGIARV